MGYTSPPSLEVLPMPQDKVIRQHAIGGKTTYRVCKISRRECGLHIGLRVGEPQSETRFRMSYTMPRKLEVVLVAVRLPGKRGDNNLILRPADVAQTSVRKWNLRREWTRLFCNEVPLISSFCGIRLLSDQ